MAYEVHRKTKKYQLCLLVKGKNSESLEAIQNVKCIVEQKLKDRSEIVYIDIEEHPEAIALHKTPVYPVLIMNAPAKVTIMGDFHDLNKVMAALMLPIS